jgi:cytochrome P450
MTAVDLVQPADPPRGARRVVDVVDVDLTDSLAFARGVPYEAFDALLGAGGIAWHGEASINSSVGRGGIIQFADSPGFWAVTSHRLVDEVLRNPSRFSSEAGSTLLETVTPETLPLLRASMINMDAPQHLRLRGILSAIFTPRAVRKLYESVELNAREIATEALGNDLCELVTSVSAELPLRVLADLLGMPHQDRHLLFKWSDAAVASEKANDAETVAAGLEAYGESLSYAQRMAEERRARPLDDIVSMIANAEVGGDRLSDSEFAMFWMLLVVAGNETTRNAVSGAVISLIEHGQWNWLATHPEHLPSAVEELLRYISPVLHFRRTATEDTVLGDQHIRAGDKVVVWFSAANRDPAVFTEPHQLRLLRDPNPHLAFGIGPHFCLGAHLARLELTHMLAELLNHAPNLHLAGIPTRVPSNFINGISTLPVVFR